MTIIITKRFGGYHTCIEGIPSMWGCGRNVDEAVGSLVRCHSQQVGLKIVEDKEGGSMSVADKPPLGEKVFMSAGSPNSDLVRAILTYQVKCEGHGTEDQVPVDLMQAWIKAIQLRREGYR